MEVGVAEGVVRMGLRLAALCALSSLFSEVVKAFYALAGVLDGLWLIKQRRHHVANVSSSALGHKQLFVDEVIILLLRIPQRGIAVCW